MTTREATHVCESWQFDEAWAKDGDKPFGLERCRTCGAVRSRWTNLSKLRSRHAMRSDWELDWYVFHAPVVIRRVGCHDPNSDALDRIAALICGVEWTPDTLDRVAAIVRESGRMVFDVDEEIDWLSDDGYCTDDPGEI